MREFLLRTIGVIALNKRSMHQIMTDNRSTVQGILTLIVAFIVHVVPFYIIWGQFFEFTMISSYVSWMVSFVLFTVIGPIITNKYFGGHVSIQYTFRVLAPLWLIQIIGGLTHIVLVLMSGGSMDHPFVVSAFFYAMLACIVYVTYSLFTEEFRVSDEDAVIALFLTIIITVTSNSVISSFLS